MYLDCKLNFFFQGHFSYLLGHKCIFQGIIIGFSGHRRTGPNYGIS